MDLFIEDDYRKVLKFRQKELQVRRPGLTWRKLASEIPMQYTYLSKALNDDKTHLSEDNLFVICRALEFFPQEIDFISLLRAHATAQDAERKNYVFRKISEVRLAQHIQAKDQTLSSTRLDEQIRYLFEPLCLIVHQALEIEDFRKDPRRLCSLLTINPAQLKEILRILSRNDYIELGPDGMSVHKVKSGNIHFGPEHFLMRYHLSIVKSQILARLARTPDPDRFSFLVTFTLDEKGFSEIREEFKKFLQSAEKIASRAKTEHVYQLSFDLFKWL